MDSVILCCICDRNVTCTATVIIGSVHICIKCSREISKQVKQWENMIIL